jgi:hypothetical protein
LSKTLFYDASIQTTLQEDGFLEAKESCTIHPLQCDGREKAISFLLLWVMSLRLKTSDSLCQKNTSATMPSILPSAQRTHTATPLRSFQNSRLVNQDQNPRNHKRSTVQQGWQQAKVSVTLIPQREVPGCYLQQEIIPTPTTRYHLSSLPFL